MTKTEICSTLEEAREKWPEYNGVIGNRFKNISGQHINNLTILYRGPNLEDAKKRPRYVCKCDCGAYCCIKSENITSVARPTRTCGHCNSFKLSQKKEINGFNILNTFINEKDNNRECCTLQCQKCGYIFYPRKTDLYDNATRKICCAKCNSLKTTNNFNIGDKIGELTLLSFKVNEDNCIRWECRCSCGEKLYLKSTELNGRRTCGKHNNPNDIVGKKFNKLIVLQHLDYFKGNNRYYQCRCDCGTVFEVSRSNIISGHTSSCGCIRSKNEEQISQLLNILNKAYIKNKTYNDLRGNNKQFLKFDFFIDNQYIIEYDGQQHFNYANNGWNNKENFEKTRKRDLIKNKYCFDNNIPLIRIPYDADYTIDDLRLETTRFLLTPENEKEYYESRS